MVDFLFVIIELFRNLLRSRCYKQKSVDIGIFRRGWVTLSANSRWKGALPTNQCWCQKTRVTAVLTGIKICAVHCLVLSQSMRVTDRRTDSATIYTYHTLPNKVHQYHNNAMYASLQIAGLVFYIRKHSVLTDKYSKDTGKKHFQRGEH